MQSPKGRVLKKREKEEKTARTEIRNAEERFFLLELLKVPRQKIPEMSIKTRFSSYLR